MSDHGKWGSGGIRPEDSGATADDFYSGANVSNYQASSRVKQIQKQLSQRALALLELPPNQSCFLLDIGAGTGLSGQAITACGHQWIGFDISPQMLGVAVDKGCEGDMFAQDAGAPFSFRAGVFDGAISISAIQWLVSGDPTMAASKLYNLFSSLKRALAPGARAALQFYPEASDQVHTIADGAKQLGFKGGVLIDYPNSAKGKKFYLVVQAPGKRMVAAKSKTDSQNKPKKRASGGELTEGQRRKMEARIARDGWAPGMHKLNRGAE